MKEVTIMKTVQLAALYFICLLGILPVAVSAQPYVISTDGTEVTDQKTGLIWQRCPEGMVFGGGTCTGTTALTYTHEAALQRAAAVTSLTAAWRLPSVKELSSIADKTLSNPAIDPAAFPATPASFFWSSSPYVGLPAYAWGVYFYYGHVSGYVRSSTYYVRLVRAGQ